MLLANELKQITQKLITKASRKEIAFYYFLIGEAQKYSDSNDLSDIEQVCLAAFCIGAPYQKKLLEKLQKTKPIKGIHYTNNITELTAFARINYKNELENLKSYCSTHSTRDYFILKKLFPAIDATEPTQGTSVDQIAAHLIKKDLPVDWKPLFFNALITSTNLLDVYVLKECYLEVLDRKSLLQYETDLYCLAAIVFLIINKIDKVAHFIMILVGFIVVTIVTWFLLYLIAKDWNSAEPFITAISIVVGAVFLIYSFIKGQDIDKYNYITLIKSNISNILKRKLGINTIEYESIVEGHNLKNKLEHELTVGNQDTSLSIRSRR